MTDETHEYLGRAAEHVADREIDEAAWLEARRSLVTASESAHLMGLLASKPWGLLPDELAERKLDPSPQRVGPPAHAGRWWEGPDLAWAARVTGLRLLPSSSLWRSRAEPSMGATTDALALPGGERDPEVATYLTVMDEWDSWSGDEAAARLAEAVADAGWATCESKHQESKRRSRWTKPGKAPKDYVCQARHQALVHDAPLSLLVARVDANEVYVHIVPRDRPYEEVLAKACRTFRANHLV